MTVTSLALISTSDAADGVRTLARSDCAAVHWARQASEDAMAMCPAGDTMAAEYVLAAGIRSVQDLQDQLLECDAVYVGTGGADLVGDIYLARWAERLKATLLSDVLACMGPTQDVYQVTCDAGRGARYVLSVRGPVIMVLSPHVARSLYVSRYRRDAAARQLSGQRSCAHDPAGDGMHAFAWSPVRPRVRAVRAPYDSLAADHRLDGAFSIQAGDSDEGTNLIVADPETCARHILRYLAHYCILPVTVSDDPLQVPDARPVTTDSTSSETERRPCRIVSSCAMMERRPRLAGESLARRARQPRPAGEAAPSNCNASPSGFSERGPRHAKDSSARRARQPRRLDRP